ncbi:DUF6252 family protein [Xanthomarina sp.]|uniref:DUF6252 family protein n=1 Tax=Xanthomarina sp. TaxID=1931211 RepID=UPI002CB0FB0D|nr:DUF6252 family protein [Xanthomarina sp.]HLV40468.1 DUF6252 family protein [Xanthomarina sp.]
MKTFKTLLFFTFITIVSSCSKDSITDSLINIEDDQNNGNDRVAMRAMVEGVEFKAYYSGTRAGINENSFFVEGFTPSDTKLIRLVTDNFDGLGTYALFAEGYNPTTIAEYVEIDQPSQDNNQNYAAPHEQDTLEGEFTITHLSANNVKGTFYFKATNSDNDDVKNITEGTFDSVLYR